MKTDKTIYLSLIVVMVMILSSCTIPTLKSVSPPENLDKAGADSNLPMPTLIPASQQAEGQGTVLITGGFDYTNEFVLETYYVENAVALLDMTGFITRDKEWELPVESQVLGYMDVDQEKNHGSFRLQLPARPSGIMNDVDNDGKKESGLQIFAVGYSPNLSGGPFSEGDDRSLGWPSYLASVKTNPEKEDEITGGRLVIWAADDQQEFPTSFGADGLLFTHDDPVSSIPAGYSVIDLDQNPFVILRDQEVKLSLYEPADIAVKDFSTLSFSQSFDSMFEVARKEYAFVGVKGKEPDWDKVYASVSPKVKDAEKGGDSLLFYSALKDFTDAFNDGHVGLSAGDLGRIDFQKKGGFGYGMALRELEDGRVVVVFVLSGSPADGAGIKVGAEIFKYNDLTVGDAISLVYPLFGPYSTEAARRYDQVLFLMRAPAGKEVKISYSNPGESMQKSITLLPIQEYDSLFATYVFGEEEPLVPVEFEILPSGAGYVKISSNYDDLNLVIRLFQRALKKFEENGVTGLIIDLRKNSGGASLGLAGFLYDQDILMGQLEYFSSETGQFEPEGLRDKVWPNEEQYRFEKMALLIGNACFSACELEAYSFSQVPGMIVTGMFPTGGVEAETARGKFLLPADLELTIPTGRYTLPDGSIFLEGVGVQPTLKVPITYENIITQGDPVLEVAEKAVSN
jgi:C-terminal processing protease CtpA/Prc